MDSILKLYESLKAIRVYLIKIGPKRRKGNILESKLNEINAIYIQYETWLIDFQQKVKNKYYNSEDILLIENYCRSFLELRENILSLCESDQTESVPNMSTFDLKTALQLLPVMTDEESNTKQLIDNIEYYNSILKNDTCKENLINFVLKSRLSQEAKLKMKLKYDTISELINDMKNVLLCKKAATAIQNKLLKTKQHDMSITDYGKEITKLFVDLTVSQANGNDQCYNILKPHNEKMAINKFADGLRNRRISTIISARNYSSLKDAVQAAEEEEATTAGTSGEIWEDNVVAIVLHHTEDEHAVKDTGASPILVVKGLEAELMDINIKEQADDDDRPPISMEVKKHDKPGSLSPVKPALKRDSREDLRTSRSSSKSEKELRLPPEKSPCDDGGLRKERRLSRASESSKDTFDRQDSKSTSLSSPKVSRKYFTNWRQACDKTKDKTKELLKRWRTLPETEGAEPPMQAAGNSEDDSHRGWSVHVWTTWVNRCSEDLECLDLEEEQPLAELSSMQTDKLTLFFTELLDHDRDDVICDQDFDQFFEKLAHFADWSPNSSEFHILLEVKREFIEHFINPLPSKWCDLPYYRRVCGPEASGINIPGRTTLEGWLARWALHLSSMKRFTDLPLYLQYLCKILFHVVDRTSTGAITKTALAAFYRSVIGLNANRVDEIIDTAYDRMTSNGYLILDYGTYVHCFTNWLMGKNPNGPGQWVLVPPKDSLPQPPFPVDYSALNTEPAKLEPYAPDKKTNRHSVIV